MGINHKHELLQLYLNKVPSVSWLEHLSQNKPAEQTTCPPATWAQFFIHGREFKATFQRGWKNTYW